MFSLTAAMKQHLRKQQILSVCDMNNRGKGGKQICSILICISVKLRDIFEWAGEIVLSANLQKWDHNLSEVKDNHRCDFCEETPTWSHRNSTPFSLIAALLRGPPAASSPLLSIYTSFLYFFDLRQNTLSNHRPFGL